MNLKQNKEIIKQAVDEKALTTKMFTCLTRIDEAHRVLNELSLNS